MSKLFVGLVVGYLLTATVSALFLGLVVPKTADRHPEWALLVVVTGPWGLAWLLWQVYRGFKEAE